MSLPGILAPVEYDGRLLVDGGMAMNIPVDVGREMGGQTLVVVDIGTPLKTREEINSVLGVTDQILGFLTRKNSVQQLSTLTSHDVLISPDLTGIGMLDFDQAEEIYRRGYEATMALADRLSPLALDAARWQAHLARRTIPEPGSPLIDYVAIRNDSGLSDDLIRVRISQPLGEALDREQLNRDIESIYALDYWELIDYELLSGDAGTGLVISARAKTWGNTNLKLGLSLLTDLDGSNEIDVGASYLYKGVNELGGELYSQVQLGDTLLLRGGLYQPLDLHSRYFLQPHLAIQDYRVRALGP
jgi:NTE family protein